MTIWNFKSFHLIKAIGNIKNHQISIQKTADYTFQYSPFDDEECKKCAILPICGGGCPIDRAKKHNVLMRCVNPAIKEGITDNLIRLYNIIKNDR